MQRLCQLLRMIKMCWISLCNISLLPNFLLKERNNKGHHGLCPFQSLADVCSLPLHVAHGHSQTGALLTQQPGSHCHRGNSQPAKLWGFISSGSAFSCFSLQICVMAAFHVLDYEGVKIVHFLKVCLYICIIQVLILCTGTLRWMHI